MNANRGMLSLINSPVHIRASFFHSSPILERRRRTYWDSGGRKNIKGPSRRFNYENKRFRKFNSKQTLLRNVGAIADDLFQILHHDFDDYDSSSSQGWEWFQQDFRSNVSSARRSRNKGYHKWRGFHFVEDLDFEVDSIFRTGLGGKDYYRWSFVNEDVRDRHSSRHSNIHGNSKWRFRFKDEYGYDDKSTECDTHESGLVSERLALGLNASGPLNLEDVKNAYRACAFKWHPDRHQGPSKIVAEEKFKACSAAYRLLCDKMALN
ncbi:unnamed protein product [Cuscuta epithymum]|uniref:J domain-containing protein n=1 Tax=Cuscuta epithymum TaxID=186058 RepID=A0AAV0DZK9_9ASTE|nr:unnamed protein product [Cuscuta epithymum]